MKERRRRPESLSGYLLTTDLIGRRKGQLSRESVIGVTATPPHAVDEARVEYFTIARIIATEWSLLVPESSAASSGKSRKSRSNRAPLQPALRAVLVCAIRAAIVGASVENKTNRETLAQGTLSAIQFLDAGLSVR